MSTSLKTPLVALSVALSFIATGCGGDAELAKSAVPPATATVKVTSTPTPLATPTVQVVLTEPTEIAKAMKVKLRSMVGKVVTINENNDANDLIGRPGQYDAAVFMEGPSLGCSGDFDELSVDCGAKIERWTTRADANARKDDIQQKLKDYGLGAEWDYVSGPLVLRVAGDVKPSVAAKYEAAFRQLVE